MRLVTPPSRLRAGLPIVLLCALAPLARAADAPGVAPTAPAPVVAPAPAPAPAPVAAPAPNPSPLTSMRLKLSAGDLASAESILEVYRLAHGEDGYWLQGLGWLARGALLLDQPAAADRYAALARARCEARLARGVTAAGDDSLAQALGAAIEVEAQRLARTRGRAAALRHLESERAKVPAPVSLRSRIEKRANLIALEGAAAPPLVLEESVGAGASSVVPSLRGAPTLIYVWNPSCGDCRAQAPSLCAVAARWRERGLRVVGLTRHYGDDRAAETADIEKVWREQYAGLGDAPSLVSTASMELYGGSSTPTFVLVDARGVVRRYAPTRFTEEALEREVAALFR